MIAATAFSITVSIVLAILLIRKPKIVTRTRVKATYLYRELTKDQIIDVIVDKDHTINSIEESVGYSADFDQRIYSYLLRIDNKYNVLIYSDESGKVVILKIDQEPKSPFTKNDLYYQSINLIEGNIYSILEKELK